MRDKNPLNRRTEAVDAKGFKAVTKSVKPVAKDTNKTRRPKMKAGEQIATESPKKPHKGKSKHY